MTPGVPLRAIRCGWCRRYATGVDGAEPECARCCRLRGGPPPLAHLAGLLARFGLGGVDALAAAHGIHPATLHARVEAFGLGSVLRRGDRRRRRVGVVGRPTTGAPRKLDAARAAELVAAADAGARRRALAARFGISDRTVRKYLAEARGEP